MNEDEIKNLARKIERTVCPGCIRRKDERLCITCPVAELVDMFKIEKRTLISRQQFEYLYDVGVVSRYTGSFDLVRYPDGMGHCSLLDGDMREDLLKDTPRIISFNIESHESPDTRINWAIPEWLFMENQQDVLKAYFRRTGK